MEGRTILVIDDDQVIAELMSYHLTRDGFEVYVASRGDEVFPLITSHEPDLALLDYGLPGLSGIEVLREIKESTDIPVIMVTARREEIDRIIALELGAEDYVLKPFSPRELVARVNAVLRRVHPQPANSEGVVFDSLTIFPDRHVALCNGKPVNLTTTEFRLLSVLMSHPTRVYSRAELFNKVWGYSVACDTRPINTHMRNLRQKLGSAGSVIETVRGVGYRMRTRDDNNISAKA